MLAALWLASSASASDWYLETHDRRERDDATAWEQAIEPTGVEAHVVRRFVDGEGWRFLVRAEGFEDEAQVTLAAHTVADAIDETVTVFRSDGPTAARVTEVEPSSGPEPAAEEEDEAPDATPELEAAVKALGVSPALRKALDGGPLLLAYRRTLPDGRVADHTWARDAGGAVRVEIDKVSGEVVPSRILVSGDQAWLSVDGGPWQAQNAEKARQLVDTLGPTDILPLLLQMEDAVASRHEFERMAVDDPGTFDGEPTTRLVFPGDATSGALALDLDADHLPVRLQLGEGDTAVVHEFREYRDVKGRHLPARITTTREGGTDVVELETLEADAQVPDDWFRVPR